MVSCIIMSSPPLEKKRKSSDGSAARSTSSWRDKSIEKFNLRPVPDGWKDSVAIGTEDTWERYYMYRVGVEENGVRDDDADGDGSGDDDDDDDDDDRFWNPKRGMDDVLFSWKFRMTERMTECMVDECLWQWTPQKPDLEWEEEDKLRSANYNSHVWSPYAIPHAIKLSHSWYGKMKWSYYDLATDWQYMLIDFEGEDEKDTKEGRMYVELCSNNYDVITTTNLNKTTCTRLRKFLYGTNSNDSKVVTCSDKNFWILLFGSMGSADNDLMEDSMNCTLGYSWCPWKNEAMKNQLFHEKAPADDDPNGEPPTQLKGYNPRWCSWLRYRILDVSDSLGPISKHYKPPPPARSDDDDNDDDDDDNDDDN